jgi:hypothetical protein
MGAVFGETHAEFLYIDRIGRGAVFIVAGETCGDMAYHIPPFCDRELSVEKTPGHELGTPRSGRVGLALECVHEKLMLNYRASYLIGIEAWDKISYAGPRIGVQDALNS